MVNNNIIKKKLPIPYKKPKVIKKTSKKNQTKKIKKVIQVVTTSSDGKIPKKDRKPVKLKKKTPKANIYWTAETEKGIVDYNKATSLIEKNKIYIEVLKHAFEKLVENIFNKFKFTYVESSPISMQHDCITHLISVVDKFNVNKGAGKSFGYFSIAAKNYFILINNANYKKWKTHESINPLPEDSDQNDFFIKDDKEEKIQESASEFIQLMIEYWESNVNKMFPKQKDLDIANAIIEIFRQSKRIDCFNKKALYLYIREISGCKTQNIAKIITKMKTTHNIIYNDYLNHGSIDRFRYKLDKHPV